MVDFSKELNEVQHKAVVDFSGPSLIIAGAGSGKTRVLTYRIAYILSQGVDPHSVLALTFTNKAAREMKERIGVLVGSQLARRLWMGTFHSIFARILRAEAQHIGYKSSFTIYDTTDSKSVIKACIKELNLDDNAYKVGDVMGRISMAKNHLVPANVYRNNATLTAEDAAMRKPRIADIYVLYEQKCKLSDAMDFDDLLLNTNILFRDHPEVLKKYQQLFKYVLVDEYQDTNRAQYLIVKKLAEMHHNVAVVGDDAQSIYAFRGARIENILNFRNDYPEYKEYKLEQNYRSTQTIVNAANSVIRHNSRQLQKSCFSDDEVGDKIAIIESYTDQEEAFLVASSITETIYAKRASYNDFAILYRTNAQSRAMEDALRRKNIPYKIYGGLSFYQRAEVKDIMAYLRLSVNHNDDEAFKRVINYPARGIGNTTMEHLQYAASAASISLWDAVVTLNFSQTGVKPAAEKKLKEFAELIVSFTTQAFTTDAYDFALNVAQRSGMIGAMREDKSPEGIGRFENLEELLNSIKEFSDTYQREEDEVGDTVVSITEYLQDVALLTDADNEKPEDRNKVSLMTVHSAKGLEFTYVYVVGMEDNLFPGGSSLMSPVELEEERRLFYVALTRAEKKLTLSFSQTRYRWGNVVSNPPSRFLKEIDEEYLESSIFRRQTDNTDDDDDSDTNQPIMRKPERTVMVRRPSLAKPHQPSPDFNPDDPSAIEAGMDVEHERFGFGKVEAIEGNGGERKAVVAFQENGKKTLLLRFAKLKICK